MSVLPFIAMQLFGTLVCWLVWDLQGSLAQVGAFFIRIRGAVILGFV